MNTIKYNKLHPQSHKGVKRPNAILRTAQDGSFLLTGFIPALGGRTRVEFQAQRGLYSMLTLKGKTWKEATVRVGRARQPGVMLVSARSAQSNADGGVKATAITHSSEKRVLRRELNIARDGKRRWRYEDHLPDGAMITGEGTRNKTTRLVRRRTNAAGTLVWTTESEAKRTGASNGSGREPVIPATLATIRSTRADGAVGTTRKLSWADAAGFHARAETGWSGSPDGMKTMSYTQDTSFSPDGKQTITTVRQFADGSEQIIVSIQNPYEDSSTGPMTPSGDVTRSSETTTSAVSSDGETGVTSHESSSWTEHEDGSMSGTWENSVTDANGNTTTERGSAAMDQEGNLSVTTSHIDADGNVSVTTTTTDSDGNGTEHTTTTDSEGNVTKDETNEVHGDSGDSGSSGSGGSGSGGSGGGDNSGDGHDGDNGGDNGDHGSGGGGDSGMEWDGEGGSDEGPRGLPIHSGDAADNLDNITQHGGGDDWGEGNSYSDQIGQAMARDAFSPEAGGSDTGWGDTGSGEGPTVPHYGAGIDLNYAGPPSATEDWGDVNNPRALVALTENLIDSLAHTGALVASSNLAWSMLANRMLGARIGQVLAQNQR